MFLENDTLPKSKPNSDDQKQLQQKNPEPKDKIEDIKEQSY